LSDYGRELREAVDRFDVAETERMLQLFSELVEGWRGLVQGFTEEN